MNRYEIRCTTDQTYKAIKLGAPCCNPDDYEPEICPTAEQMIGWIEKQKNIRSVEITNSFGWYYRVKTTDDLTHTWIKGFKQSRKSATLAAIDAALEYLTNKK